jgi:molybdopterin-guanine dinucleotide biosynthesis protein A
MGQDKALLPWGASSLLDHAIARLREVASEVWLLTGEAPRYQDRGLPVVLDALPGAGPAAGLLAALERADAVLLLAVDVPAVPVELLHWLGEGLASADAVVPRSPAGPEPLCAAYAASCAGPLRKRLLAGDRRMTSFWPEVRVLEPGALALARFGDPERIFANLNEPADLVRARGR